MTEDAGMLCRSVAGAFGDVVASAEAAITAAGAAVVARIDHREAAAGAGLELRPTILFLFGNPAAGTLVMQVCPTSAIDLPMKLLVFAEDDRDVRIVGEDPALIAARHGAGESAAKVVAGMRTVMERVLALTAAGTGASAS